MAPSASELSTLKQLYSKAGQSHVFTFWDQLSSEEQTALYVQLLAISPERVNAIYDTAVKSSALSSDSHDQSDDHAVVSPPPKDRVGTVLGQRGPEHASEWETQGLSAVKQGKVAVLLMAGGQGTRLGSSAPKGCYDIGLPSRKSLFQLQAERIRRLQTVAAAGVDRNVVVPWYIMTSGPTRKPTEEYFAEHDYFGLDKANVIFFEQGVLPCLTNEGKIMLDSPSRVAVAPDGNGGIYAGLRAPLSAESPRSVLSDMADRGIEFIHAYGVDNCLVRVADPIFVGYCASRGADCGVKVVKKIDPTEAVGVVALRGDKFGVVEYSEIPEKLSRAREDANNDSSDLKFRAANIANHFYTREFLETVSTFEHEMAYHIARKKIPCVDLATGQVVKPAQPNGMKLELFVFDVFPFTTNFAILEVGRETDFSPLKNAPGTGADDPDTSRRDLLKEQRRWLEMAGASFESDDVVIELSPLVSYAGEGLRDKVDGLKFATSGMAETVEDLVKLAA